MMRNFCVMTVAVKLFPSTMQWGTRFDNHRVLVGSQEKVDTCNEKIKAKLASGTFTVNEQLHVM